MFDEFRETFEILSTATRLALYPPFESVIVVKSTVSKFHGTMIRYLHGHFKEKVWTASGKELCTTTVLSNVHNTNATDKSRTAQHGLVQNCKI